MPKICVLVPASINVLEAASRVRGEESFGEDVHSSQVPCPTRISTNLAKIAIQLIHTVPARCAQPAFLNTFARRPVALKFLCSLLPVSRKHRPHLDIAFSPPNISASFLPRTCRCLYRRSFSLDFLVPVGNKAALRYYSADWHIALILHPSPTLFLPRSILATCVDPRIP
ncbi:hypothetical protein BCR34DRAFT_32277 [Clohesyomyces aquaticus]|uniref:Uncharacterized protein n=1 Tax=Clohesyomyces aquaticus TaxID=1231657 RepID=A0A1Y1Z8S9_9PLEO|nr:hypothetical protein BCR34DRAFT_32277 [Clohesyomyces aquaticus]